MSLHQQNPYIVSMQGSLKTNAQEVMKLPQAKHGRRSIFSKFPFKINLFGFIAWGNYDDVQKPGLQKQGADAATLEEEEGNSAQDVLPEPSVLQRVTGEDEKSDTAPAGSAEESGIEVNNGDPNFFTAFYIKDTSQIVKFFHNKNLQDIDVLPSLVSEIFKTKRNECIVKTGKPDDPLTEEFNLFESMTKNLIKKDIRMAEFEKLTELLRTEDEEAEDKVGIYDTKSWFKTNFSRIRDAHGNLLAHGVHLCVVVNKPLSKHVNTVHNFYLFKTFIKSMHAPIMFVYQGSMTNTIQHMQKCKSDPGADDKSSEFINAKPDDTLVTNFKKHMDDLFTNTQASSSDGISYYECEIETDNGYWHDSAQRILQSGEEIEHNSAMDNFVHAIAKRLFKIEYAEHKKYTYNLVAKNYMFKNEDDFHVIVRFAHGRTWIFFCAKDHVPHNCTPCTREHALGSHVDLFAKESGAQRQSTGGGKTAKQGLYTVNNDRELLARAVLGRKDKFENRGRQKRIDALTRDLSKKLFMEPPTEHDPPTPADFKPLDPLPVRRRPEAPVFFPEAEGAADDALRGTHV